MFNLPVKLAVLSTPYFPLSPQVFLGRSPESSLAVFLETLPERVRNVLDFSFSPRAILLLLEHEFEVRVARREMVFHKPALDAQSWLFANGLTECPDLPETVSNVVEQITEDLWARTANCTTAYEPLEDRLALRRELKTLLTLYYFRYARQKPQMLYALQSLVGLKRFLTLVVAEAMYKADGAKALFGLNAAYTRLWEAKQIQFYRYATFIDQSCLKLPA